jgi:hypothetical protein
VKIVRNPSAPGSYTFEIGFVGVDGDSAGKHQAVHITN